MVLCRGLEGLPESLGVFEPQVNMTTDSTQKCPPRVVSKCCGAEVEKYFDTKYYTTSLDIQYHCSKCHKSCEVEAKEGEDDKR